MLANARLYYVFCLGSRFFARLNPIFDHLSDVIDTVQIGIGYLTNLGFDIPRHSQINQKHGFVLTLLKRALDSAFAEQG